MIKKLFVGILLFSSTSVRADGTPLTIILTTKQNVIDRTANEINDYTTEAYSDQVLGDLCLDRIMRSLSAAAKKNETVISARSAYDAVFNQQGAKKSYDSDDLRVTVSYQFIGGHPQYEVVAKTEVDQKIFLVKNIDKPRTAARTECQIDPKLLTDVLGSSRLIRSEQMLKANPPVAVEPCKDGIDCANRQIEQIDE